MATGETVPVKPYTRPHTSSVIAVFDLDGTITDCDTYVEFLKICLGKRWSRVFYSLHLPLAVALHKIGARDNSWLKETFLSAIAGGARQPLLTEIVDSLVSDVMDSHIRRGALPVIEAHRKAGHQLWLVSASFDFYVNLLGANLGFDKVVCTSAARTHDDALAGTINGKNCYGRAKVDALLSAIPDRNDHTLIAYSDHHSDWALFEESDVPVAVNPTRELRRLAESKKIDIQIW